jgi:hypothetical protein
MLPWAVAAAVGAAVAGWTGGQTLPQAGSSNRPAQTARERTKGMPDQFTTAWSAEPIKIDVLARPIIPTPRPALARAYPSTDRTARRCFVNDSLNSRVVHEIGGASAWRVRWRESFQAGMMPLCLMTAGHRIVVQSVSEWNLWDTNGKLLAAGPLTASGMTIDPATSVFFTADHAGLIIARQLDDGQIAFRASLTFGADFARTFIARRRQKLFTLSFQMPTDPHLPEPEKSMLEMVDLGDPSPQKSFGQSGAPVVAAELTRATRLMVPAMSGDIVTVATEDRLFRLDMDLHFQGVITGFFSPRFISIDEGGITYLLADARDGAVIWQLSQNGERFYNTRFPAGTVPSMPAAVGYDHTAYVVAGSTIFSIASDGKLNWSRTTAGAVAGVAVTPDDLLLVAEGSELAVYNRRGERRTVHTFAGERLSSPPIFTESGDLLVASGVALYSLEPVAP